MMLDPYIGHSFSWEFKLGSILAHKTIGMQEEFLAENVILTKILILNICMRLIEFFKISKLVIFWNVSFIFFVLRLEFEHVSTKL